MVDVAGVLRFSRVHKTRVAPCDAVRALARTARANVAISQVSAQVRPVPFNREDLTLPPRSLRYTDTRI